MFYIGAFHHWKQDPQDSEVQGPGPWPTRGHVLPDQEGCVHQEASGEEQEGQGRQVQAYSRRIQDSSSRQVCYLPLIALGPRDTCFILFILFWFFLYMLTNISFFYN